MILHERITRKREILVRPRLGMNAHRVGRVNGYRRFPMRRTPQRPWIWSAPTCRRFRQAPCRGRLRWRVGSPEPLDAALPGRQVGQAAKALTSHRTPNLCHRACELVTNSAIGRALRGNAAWKSSPTMAATVAAIWACLTGAVWLRSPSAPTSGPSRPNHR